MKYKCIYKNCKLGCRTITQHNARYSKIKTQDTSQMIKKPKKSSRINYKILKKLLGTI